MARTLYGGGEASYFLPGTGGNASVYGTEVGAKAQTPADLVTDLLGPDGATAQTQIIARGLGTYSFYGPDGRTAPLWVSDKIGGAIRIDPDPRGAYARLPSAGVSVGKTLVVASIDGTTGVPTLAYATGGSGGVSYDTDGMPLL